MQVSKPVLPPQLAVATTGVLPRKAFSLAPIGRAELAVRRNDRRGIIAYIRSRIGIAQAGGSSRAFRRRGDVRIAGTAVLKVLRIKHWREACTRTPEGSEDGAERAPWRVSKALTKAALLELAERDHLTISHSGAAADSIHNCGAAWCNDV